MNMCGYHLQNHRGRPVGEGQLLLELTQLPTVPILGTIEVNSKYPKYFGKKFFKRFFFFFLFFTELPPKMEKPQE